jgi:putative tricarboxylic transport membrane protein
VFHFWLSGLDGLLQVRELLFLALGMAMGVVFGAIPGLGGATALALLMPLTYGLEPFSALALSGGVMGAIPMGGSITAILLNAPGTAPNAATCLDGHPLAQQGKAGLAIGAAASANSLGGLIGTASVLLVLPVAKELVLLFGPPEFFLLAVFALLTVASASRGKLLRGLVGGGLGLMISYVGYSDVTGGERFTFGSDYLWDGIKLVPALIGLFAVAEMLNLWVKGGSVARTDATMAVTRMGAGVLETFRHLGTVLRGSLIGTFVGAIPGESGTVAAFLSYSLTVQASKHPESFGKGNIEGVIAPEAAINAKDGSALIPTIAFGIPSGAEMAVFLGILILHGMQPGPLMLTDNLTEIYGLIWALTASCLLASSVGLLFVRPLAQVTRIDSTILVPLVLSVALVGSYAVNGEIENVVVTALFGVLGYIMIRFDYPRLTVVIAMILGNTAERSFLQSLEMSDGHLSIFATRTVCQVLLALILAMLAVPLWRALRGGRENRRPRESGGPGEQHVADPGSPLSRGRRSLEFLPAAGLLIGTPIYLALAYRMPPNMRAFPAVVAWVVLGLVALDLLSRTKTRLGAAVMRALNPAAEAASEARPLARQMAAVAWLLGFAALIVLAGILAAVPIYLFASFRRAGRAAWTCALGAAGATVILWALFSLVLRIALYPGLFFGGA